MVITNQNVFIGSVLDDLDDYLEKNIREGVKLFVLLDENTHAYCYDKIIKKVPALSSAEILELEPGEQIKSVEIVNQLWQILLEYGAERNSLLINLGGGTITDLGGFVASTFKRGIRFINIPTSLLSMVDASIGGKTAINISEYKNQVGTFAHPQAVYIYPPFLQTLETRQLYAGLAEMVKHALIADIMYLEKIQNQLKLEEIDWEELIKASIIIKNTIVESDPLEKKERKLLNFGHTIGHALESYLIEQGADILHGEAIWWGMLVELIISDEKYRISETDILIEWMKQYAPEINVDISYHHLEAYLLKDKKNNQGEFCFTLIKKLGDGVVDQIITEKEIENALDKLKSIK